MSMLASTTDETTPNNLRAIFFPPIPFFNVPNRGHAHESGKQGSGSYNAHLSMRGQTGLS
jgi:hypothetical protein